MTRKNAIKAFEYWGNQISTPLGNRNIKAERMRTAYGLLIDSGRYVKLPNDPLQADEQIYRSIIESKPKE